jgi:hypothetical protein
VARRELLLGTAMLATLAVPLIAQAPWIELKTPRFVLRSQLDAKTLHAVTCDLETAARALGVGEDTHPIEMPEVIAVENGRAIREWVPQFNERGRGNPLGAYWRGLFGDHIVLRVDAPPAERLRRVLHEYAHFVTHATHPDPPPWLDEGTSEIWEHTTIGKGRVEVGRPVDEHLKRLRSGKDWIPITELVAANAIPAKTDAAWTMFYAESWALVHYLMFDKGDGALRLDRIPPLRGLPTDAELQGYVRGAMADDVKILAGDADGCPDPPVAREMTRLDTLLGRAQALADGERPDSGLPLLREVLALEPANAEALETVGYIHFRGNRPAEAAAVFDEVIDEGGASFVAYYYRAILAGPIPERAGSQGPVPQVDYLRKALALNPAFAPAARRLKELTIK